MKRFVEEVFVTEGLPQFTFVKPPNFNDILLDVRHPGKPVIVEGQSGTGKTSCVRKILELLGGTAPEYLTARSAEDVHRIDEIANSKIPGRFVIDDFHRLASDTQAKLADLAKFAAESGPNQTKCTKLVLIGINEVGSELIQLVPDIAKRTGLHRIQTGTRADIERLVKEGSLALNVVISDTESIYRESRGDFWLTRDRNHRNHHPQIFAHRPSPRNPPQHTCRSRPPATGDDASKTGSRGDHADPARSALPPAPAGAGVRQPAGAGRGSGDGSPRNAIMMPGKPHG